MPVTMGIGPKPFAAMVPAVLADKPHSKMRTPTAAWPRASNQETFVKMKNMEQPRVLVVEDDTDLRTELVDFLQFYGLKAQGEGSVAGMLSQLRSRTWDVLVLDLGLPDGDGVAAARHLRQEFKLSLGIVMVTARGHADDRIAGLTAGADTYLVKPVNPRELTAVISQLMLRLSYTTHDAQAEYWQLNLSSLALTAPNGQASALTGAEALIVGYLMRSAGQIVSRNEVIKHLPLGGAPDETRRLDTLLSRLRSKVLQETGEELPVKTFRNLGYSFVGKVGEVVG